MMAVVPTSLMQRYENYPLVDKLYSIKHFTLSWDPFGCPKFGGYIFLYDDYAIDVSETTRFTLLEENNFPFYPLVHTIETLVRIPRRRLLIDVVGKVISWRFLGFNCVFGLLLQDHSKEKRKEVNQRYHAKKKDKQQIETEPLQNIDNQPRQRTIRNANNASTSRGIGPIDKENISPHNASTSRDIGPIDKENISPHSSGETIEEQNDARDYEVGNNEEASITGEHHFTHDEENTEICSAITYETQNDVRGDTEVHLNPINEDDPYDFVYDRTPVVHRVLAGRTECNHCGAIKFKSEFATFCCMNGKTKLASTHIPPELYHLFTSQDEIGHMFRDNIRAYNTNFSFTSMGVTLDNDLTNMKSGVYTFRAHGGIYHRIDQLVPRDGKPRYLQLYFYDSETEFTHRLKWPNLDKTIIRYLTASLTSNPYVKTFRSLRDLGPLDNYRVTLNASVELDQRVYNRPTTAEVAGIWVEGNENITTYKRSIVVYGRSDYSTQIQPYEGCYDPLSYPLFFPNGESGWHSRIARKSVSINEIVVDEENMEEDVEETSRLLYYRLNQKKIRSELYQGIVDCINAGEVEPNKVGQRVVLPASFIGGPRDMRRRFLDAMTLVQDDGKPDIFLTITCNPGWPEMWRDNRVVKKVRDKILDNRWVVPYNPKLLMMFNCHLNVEVCSSIKSVKYAFKYVYKGHDKQVVHIDPDEPQSKIDEIKRYQDARYVSPPEAIWRIFSFALSQIYPSVMALHLHLPNQQLVRFSDNDIITDIVDRERDKSSMLTTFFKINKVDGVARKYLYKEFPTYFTWDSSKRCWNQRKKGAMRGRLVSANPAEGERYYLRVLLSHVRGPTCFDDLYTVNIELYPTFRKAAVERGLVETDDNLSQCLTEASLFQFPAALRRLFATILIYCEPGDVRKLWDEHYNSLSEDYSRQCQSYERVKTMVLVDIGVFLQSMGKHLGEFDLPLLNTTINLESGGYRKVQEEYTIVVEDEHVRAKDSLNSDQKVAYDEIMRHVDCNLSGVFFIDGPGGTGKTFLYKALLAEVLSRGLIALATASSGAAANNMPGGRTAHSRFKIPINLDNNSMQAVEAVDRSIQDITKLNLPFAGKLMILGGDFRQVLLVVRRGTRAQIVDSSLRMSPLWPSIKKLSLTINMRALADPWFSEFLMRVGDGEEGAINGTFIRIPDDMSIPYTDKGKSKDDLIDAIFPSFQINGGSSDYIISRAILSTKNENVDEINDQLIDRFIGEQRVYYSFDEAEDDKNNFYPMEFLNSLNVSGLPPHYLRLKIGCPIILLRNIDPSNGLCNGTRLICKGFQMNVNDAEIAVGHHAGKRVFLPRIPLCPSADDMFPFKLKRKQLPIRLSFAMTINKAQGQTIPNVGVYLPESVFSHGQLYVALSRGISRENTKVLVKPVKDFTNEGVYTSNVVYREERLSTDKRTEIRRNMSLLFGCYSYKKTRGRWGFLTGGRNQPRSWPLFTAAGARKDGVGCHVGEGQQLHRNTAREVVWSPGCAALMVAGPQSTERKRLPEQEIVGGRRAPATAIVVAVSRRWRAKATADGQLEHVGGQESWRTGRTAL
ncbi:hypothetical protein LXL04_007626 [Taraxacum kok-saghyz]